MGTLVLAWKAWEIAVKVMDALSALSPWQVGLLAISLIVTELITHFHDIGRVVSSVFNAMTGAVNSVGNAISQLWTDFEWLAKKVYQLFSDTPLGGLFNFAKGLIGGNLSGAVSGLVQGATFGQVNLSPASLGAGPNVSPGQSSNNSVPAGQHQAGDLHAHIHVTTTLDSRVVSEQVVHQVLKRSALS